MTSGQLTLIEVGPREGFQGAEKQIPTSLKLDIINGLVQAGLRQIQVASFVNPKRIPQMADAAEVCAGLPRIDGVCYSGLCLNVKGVERARDAGLHAVDVSISVSETHGKKNTGKTLAEARVALAEMIRVARESGLKVRAGLQCVFGCAYEGTIPEEHICQLVQEIVDQGVDMLSLADSPGMAHPRQVTGLLQKVLPKVPQDITVVLHLHDTRGLGVANLMAAYDCGVTHFDTALGGIGGCPFIPGAAGNIATEEVANLAALMGHRTGIDLPTVAKWTRNLEEFLDRRLPGKLHPILNKD